MTHEQDAVEFVGAYNDLCSKAFQMHVDAYELQITLPPVDFERLKRKVTGVPHWMIENDCVWTACNAGRLMVRRRDKR